MDCLLYIVTATLVAESLWTCPYLFLIRGYRHGVGNSEASSAGYDRSMQEREKRLMSCCFTRFGEGSERIVMRTVAGVGGAFNTTCR